MTTEPKHLLIVSPGALEGREPGVYWRPMAEEPWRPVSQAESHFEMFCLCCDNIIGEWDDEAMALEALAAARKASLNVALFQSTATGEVEIGSG